MKGLICRATALFLIILLSLSLFSCNGTVNKDTEPLPAEPPISDPTESPPPKTPQSETDNKETDIVYPEISLPDAVAELYPSIIKLYCYDYDMTKITSHGTGFFIDENGTFITNAHVVKDAYFVKARVNSGEYYDVDVIYSYSRTNSDHAVCAISGYASVPVKFDTTAELGETVYALGYPGDTFEFYASKGEVVTEEKTVGNITYIENTAVIYDGNSGGILANADGEVLGIATGRLKNGEFLAVAYSEFSENLATHDMELSILDRFHDKTPISVGKDNVTSFFDVTAEPDTLSSPPKITLTVNDKYVALPADIEEGEVRISIVLVDENDTAVSEPIEFVFTSRGEMLEGITKELDPATLPRGSFYIDVLEASGSLVVYD